MKKTDRLRLKQTHMSHEDTMTSLMSTGKRPARWRRIRQLIGDDASFALQYALAIGVFAPKEVRHD